MRTLIANKEEKLPDYQWLLEPVLMLLLGATLYHALRLERALGVLKRDRASLAELVAEFNESTQQAESGIERLRQAADGAGRQIARQSEAASALKGDLSFLVERGERLADRLDRLVRSGRTVETEPANARPGAFNVGYAPAPLGQPASGRPGQSAGPKPQVMPAIDEDDELLEPAEVPQTSGRIRSQAERDLLRALKMVR